MAEVYASLIVKGLKTINDVPESIKQDVIDVLIATGHPELTEVENAD